VLDVCLKHDIHAANDISGFVSPAYAKKVADAGLPAFVMATNQVPGDPIGVDATLASLEGVMRRCDAAGVNEYVLDPGVGIWTPFRSVEEDWELCRHFEQFLRFNRPVLAAVSRKTFIGMLLNRDPEDRLPGTLAVTMKLLEKGASVIRTHDVAATRDVMRVYEQMGKGA
jgi:dihydropteroate synthase